MKIIKASLFAVAFALSSSVIAGAPVEHSHGGRTHTHPLPAEGLSHDHNGGGNSIPEASSSWFKIGKSEFYIKIGSGKLVNGHITVIGKQHNQLRDSVDVFKWSVSLEHCRNEMGELRTERLNGEHLLNSDFVFDGGNLAGLIADLVCRS